MTTPVPNVSVTFPVDQAIGRARRILFEPFDLGKWFVIGFCAWLAYLGEQGSGAGFNFGGPPGKGGGNVHDGLERARDYLMDNLYWIIPLVAGLVIVGMALWAVFLWLNSRGKFMFLHCVALNKAEVVEPWNKYAREANSLFWFRFALGLIGLALMLPFIALIGVSLYGMIASEQANAGGILSLMASGLALVLLAISFAVIHKLTLDFVVPIMYLRGKRCLDAWKEFRSLLGTNASRFVLYFLFQIVLAMAIGILIFMIVLITCCIAGCFLAIPYIGTVLLLPVLIFQRSYSLYYLAQYGSEYDCFSQ